eukprot:4659853-Alexandrium_andersonii.AAC.1
MARRLGAMVSAEAKAAGAGLKPRHARHGHVTSARTNRKGRARARARTQRTRNRTRGTTSECATPGPTPPTARPVQERGRRPRGATRP